MPQVLLRGWSPLGFETLYALCLRAADWALAHRSAVLLIGTPLVILTLVAINQFVLLDFPNSGDEYAYLYQAATLAEGRLWNPAPVPAASFRFNYIVHADGRAYSSFPIGWPLLLALAIRAGIPTWIVSPILGAVTLWLVVVLGSRLYTAWVGVLAAALTAASPFFLFNAASYFSHTFCGALLLGAACLAARRDRSPAWVPLGIGFLIGWAVLTRYLTGTVGAIPILLLLLRDRTALLRTMALVVLGGLPWVLVLLWYNDAITGSPWTLTTLPTTVSLWFRSGFALRGADILSTHLLRHALWTPPLLIAAYVFYLVTAGKETRRGALDWMLVIMAAILYFYVERGGNQYGPRFHYEVFPFLVLFVTANLFREEAYADKSVGSRRMFGLMAASVAVLPLLVVVHAVIERRVIEERSDPYSSVREAGLQNALVLIGGRIGSERSMDALDLTRNGLVATASVIYGLDISPAMNCIVSARHPDRRPYLYYWDREINDGVLVPLVCPARP